MGSFTLKQILGDKAPVVIEECPTGKSPFISKQAARDAARRYGRHKNTRTEMRPFRCAICDRYHIGHKRGAII